MYTLIIQRKHTIGTSYSDRKNGALVRASKEQLPDLQIVEEREGCCIDKEGNFYDFNTKIESGYSAARFKALHDKQIPEIRLQLELNNIR